MLALTYVNLTTGQTRQLLCSEIADNSVIMLWLLLESAVEGDSLSCQPQKYRVYGRLRRK